AATGRTADHRVHLRGDVPALHAVRQVRADHLDLGAEGRRAGTAGHRARADEARDRRGASMSAAYALYPDSDAAQRAVNGLYAAGVPEADVVVMSGEPFEHQRSN